MFGPPHPFTDASSWPWVDHLASGLPRATMVAHFGLAFATAPWLNHLTLLHTSNSPAHYAKGTPSAVPGPKSESCLRPLVSEWFQVLFHSPLGVLFTFPSRYLFTIGHRGVFSLGGWSPQIPTGFHVSCGTRVLFARASTFTYWAVTIYGRPFHAVQLADTLMTRI